MDEDNNCSNDSDNETKYNSEIEGEEYLEEDLICPLE
jgi:hypothetical protein